MAIGLFDYSASCDLLLFGQGDGLAIVIGFSAITAPLTSSMGQLMKLVVKNSENFWSKSNMEDFDSSNPSKYSETMLVC